ASREPPDGRAGGNQPKQGELRGSGLALGRDDLDGPAFVVGPPDVALALQIGEMLVNCGQGLEGELFRDFLEAGRVSLVADMRAQVVEDLVLTSSERHRSLPKRSRNEFTRISPERKHG